MLTVTEAQLLGWITPILWPFLRVLALFSALPVFAQRTVPMRLRVALALLIALAAEASLPAPPAVALDTVPAVLLVAQQLVIGLAIGFAVRVVFAAAEFAGETIGLQMGLSYAAFFDPTSGGQSTTMGRFFGVSAAWLFIVTGGHLMVIAAVLRSFEAFPAGPEPFAFLRQLQPQAWGAEIFALGLWIALPMIALLLLVNLVLGVISRVAQQINIFAVGFPVTLGVGLVGVLFTLPLMEAPFTMAIERMLRLLGG